RIALSLVLIAIPATAMGATFPLAAAWCAGARVRNRPGNAAVDASALYAANTAGAALGALAAGFWLVPTLGLRGTTGVGVVLNAIAAAGALWLSRRQPPPAGVALPPRGTRPTIGRGRAAVTAPAQQTLASTAAALSGFAALSYEVAWTRLLALVIGPTT